jgi:hypothetical protein
MEKLPPARWADVATKQQLDGLEERLALRLDATESRLRAELIGSLARARRWTLTTVLACSAGIIAAVGLTGR